MEQNLVSGLGGAHPPPDPFVYRQPAPSSMWQRMRLLTGISLLCVCLHLCSPPPALTAQSNTPAPSQQSNTRLSVPAPKAQKSASIKAKARGKSKAALKKNEPPHADVWAFSTQKPRPVDRIWSQGMAPQALKKAAVHGLTNKALKKGLTAPEVPPVLPPKAQAEKNPLPRTTGSGVPKTTGMHLRGDMDTISSGWHSSGLKNDLRIDQDMNRHETNIYGAYADIEAGDDVTVSAGPEFSHTRTQGATQGSNHSQTESGSLGLGFHLKWDF